jgi:hypothetical protein
VTRWITGTSTRTRSAHRRGPNRPSAHEALRIGHFAGEWTAGRLKVAVQETGIDLVERNREQEEPAEPAEQRGNVGGARQRFRHCRGRRGNL